MKQNKTSGTERSQMAFLQIKREIISGEREPGSVFDEKEFAEQMGVSRTPVHEAVLRSVAGIFPEAEKG